MAAHTCTYSITAQKSPNVLDIWYVDPSQGTAGVMVFLPAVNVIGTNFTLNIPYTSAGAVQMFLSAKDLIYPNGNQLTAGITKDGSSQTTAINNPNYPANLVSANGSF